MKRMFLLLFLFSMILLLPAGVSADGNISVTSTPGGATIYLDGAGTGITTSAVIDAASGSHTILLRLSGYQDYSQAVTVIDNQTSVVSASLTAVVSAPTISGISPTSGYNSSIITITITGTGFSASPSVVLAQSGQTNITATSVSVTGTTSISCQFPLTGKPAGVWTVIVTNPERTVRHVRIYHQQCRVHHNPVIGNTEFRTGQHYHIHHQPFRDQLFKYSNHEAFPEPVTTIYPALSPHTPQPRLPEHLT